MRLKRRISCLPALLVASVAIVSADATDGFVRAEMKRQNIPGLSLAGRQEWRGDQSRGVRRCGSQDQGGVTVIILMNLDDADGESIAAGVAERYLSGRR
jgi:hypothetical protein